MPEIYLQIEEVETLLELRGQELYTYLVVMGKDRDLAGDLIQDVCLKFVEQVEKGAIIKGTALQYLKTMCRNKYNEHLRTRK